MVAGDLPAWAEEQQHHHHHHHHHAHHSARQQQEQQDGAAADGAGQQGGCSSSSNYSDDDLVLPLEPAAMHHHTTPKDLKFPEEFSKVSCDKSDSRLFALWHVGFCVHCLHSVAGRCRTGAVPHALCLGQQTLHVTLH
jgi:hypothetical protein